MLKCGDFFIDLAQHNVDLVLSAWVQTFLHSDGISERFFRKKLIMQNNASMQKINYLIDKMLNIGTFSLTCLPNKTTKDLHKTPCFIYSFSQTQVIFSWLTGTEL